MTDVVRCQPEGEWPLTVGGEDAALPCELGYGGQYARRCELDTTWGEIRNECCMGC